MTQRAKAPNVAYMAMLSARRVNWAGVDTSSDGGGGATTGMSGLSPPCAAMARSFSSISWELMTLVGACWYSGGGVACGVTPLRAACCL